ncbi:hypothetical protein PR202_gb11063 [Eleusine coracana subsp. coracana]|uniref:Uncharacterized protein n=1 Tax=Eleusine coracana subsp. coracana TaxID=191504 RepID=A0AAV5CER2_ELECO|nr:hypothetical protein QOZ80_3BG0262710 [Eleusine coracana subsp. coracana]GJM96516.1 hypothetical protein PR202_ga13358 [Eleusine coracana subsp. coracana]GJN23415.1 hypothetical protein PR202_gb11063 [Eleusine coracana subsp. coracana]
MAASMKLSLTFILLLSGLVVFCEVGGAKAIDCSLIRCKQDGYITCNNYPGKLNGCACVCAPEDGKHCKLHLQDGTCSKCDKTEY